MKKILIIVFSLILIPQMALASWWNPMTWKIFNKTKQPSEIEKLKNEVEELKKKTVVPTNISQTSTNPRTATSTINKIPVKVKPVVSVPARLSNAQIIAKVKPAVVYIKTDTGAGTGMIISQDGYILTNAHVVSGSSIVNISTLNDGSYVGRVIGVNTKLDLAVIKIDANMILPIVVFGDSDKIMQGDAIFTLGFPFGISGDVAFKEGTVSRRLNDNLEISAEIHPGNSGGPLVDQYGKVVGINSSSIGNSIGGIQVGETIKFAIPINTAKANIDSLKSGSTDIDPRLEAKRKVVLFFLHITSALSQVKDTACGDAIFQFRTENYFSAKSKIDYCVDGLDLKKKNFDQRMAEDLALLNSLDQNIRKTLISDEDYNDIRSKSSVSIGWEGLSFKYYQDSINNWVILRGNEYWRLDNDIETNRLALESIKKSVSLSEEVTTKIKQLKDSWE